MVERDGTIFSLRRSGEVKRLQKTPKRFASFFFVALIQMLENKQTKWDMTPKNEGSLGL